MAFSSNHQHYTQAYFAIFTKAHTRFRSCLKQQSMGDFVLNCKIAHTTLKQSTSYLVAECKVANTAAQKYKAPATAPFRTHCRGLA